MKTIALTIITLLQFKTFSQGNLVLNGGFEAEVQSNPSQTRNYCYKREKLLVKSWYQPTCGSVDYYNSDSSSICGTPLHYAHSGQGRMGIVLDRDPLPYIRLEKELPYYKEYIQTKLTKSLEKDKYYKLGFYIVLDKRSPYKASSVGAYFSKDSLVGKPKLDKDSLHENGIPLDENPGVETRNDSLLSSTNQWVYIQGYYKAKGGERFMTLGSFGPNAARPVEESPFYNYGVFYPAAYYYIDDVSLYDANDTVRVNREFNKPYNNLVLVLDVSESMQEKGRIQALKKGVDSLVSLLGYNETISVITFEASPKILAENVSWAQRTKLVEKIDSLKAGGGTNVNASINKAYEIINKTFIEGGNNRVVFITDAGYELSSHSKKIIAANYSQKGTHFSTLIFNNIKFRHLKKTCRRTKGIYANTATENFTSCLKYQLEQPITKKISGKNKSNEYSGKIDYNYSGWTPPMQTKKSARVKSKAFIVVLALLGAMLLIAK